MPNPHCNCAAAGFCTRHKMNKSEREVQLCKGEATDKPDCGFRFWVAWENGRAGATAPENPVTVRTWECEGKAVKKKIRRAGTRKVKTNKTTGRKHVVAKVESKVGDLLSSKFKSIGIEATKGCSCKAVQRELNSHSPQDILNNLEHWAAVVQRSARKWKQVKGGIWNVIPTPPISYFRRLLKEIAEQEIHA